MNLQTLPTQPRYVQHLILGIAAGLVAPFTALAWPFAILTGIVIGKAQVDASAGKPGGGALGLVRLLGVTGGVLAMLFFGAIIGGLIAFLIVALFAFSERIAGGTSASDQMITRILTTIVAIVVWAVVVFGLNLSLQFTIGGTPGS